MLYEKATRTTRNSRKDLEFPDSINGVPFHGGAVEGADAVRKGDANDTKLGKGSGVP